MFCRSIVLSQTVFLKLFLWQRPACCPALLYICIKVKVKVKFTLEQAKKAHRGSKGIALLFNLGPRWGSVANATPWPICPRQRHPVLIVQEVRWVSGSVWTGAENLFSTGIRSPDRPTHSESCYIYTRVGTLIVVTIYLQLIQNRYTFRSFTVLQCSHQHCVKPVASDVEVVGYL